MKKFAKMSLVAALAVTGMTAANAKDLSEAIKGVDVSGSIVYRYEDYEDRAGDGDATTSTDSARNRYKAAMSIKAPVNEDVTANTRFIVGSADGNFVSLGTSDAGDSNVDVELSQVNFTYTGIKNTTVSVGKLGVATPWTNAIDADGSEQTGSGIIAASTYGPVTGVAWYLNQTNFTDAANVYGAAVIGAMGPVNAEAWYLEVEDTSDSIFAKISGSFDVAGVKVSAYVQHSETDEDANDDDLALTKGGISAKMGVFNAGVAYGETDTDGAGLASSNLVAKSGMIGWNQTLHNTDDASMLQLDLGMQVLPELHVGLNYDAIDEDSADNDSEETFVQVTYKMSKNFMTYVRFGDYSEDNAGDNEEGTRGRLHVQYTF